MDVETARTILGADLVFLTEAAGRLEQRIRTAATNYLAGCVSVATVLLASASLSSDEDSVRLETIYSENRQVVAIIALLLGVIGAIQLLTHARDRKHYVRILNSANDLRKQVRDKLGIEGKYATLWTGNAVHAWPADSATTLSFLSLVIVSLAFLVASLNSFGLSTNCIWTISVLSFIGMAWGVWRISK